MFVPDPGLAPEIPPEIAPIVHEKLLVTLDVKAIFGPLPLHVLAVAELVTIGEG